MKVAFRVDASLQIGSGHLIRCLTLADALSSEGAECLFITREHPGHLNTLVHQRGFRVQALPAPVGDVPERRLDQPAHTAWLGCDWATDVEQTSAALDGQAIDWLVVDHYALDQRWELALRSHYRRLMVIDDLADRAHSADLLLDQNLGRNANDYIGLVPERCRLLIGPRYALLRPEFGELRQYSLQRRRQGTLRNMLITMGGVDQPNATGAVLNALRNCPLPELCRVTVVMGAQARWLNQVREAAAGMPWPTEVVVNISDMAQRMADSDLAIGAAGSTAWERCCLGVPTLLVVLAENQRPGAQALHAVRAAISLGDVGDAVRNLEPAIAALSNPAAMLAASGAASEVCDGAGATRLIACLGEHQ